MTLTSEAQAVIRTGRQRLLAALRPKVAMLTELELGADAREAALATLTAFCTGRVRRHLDVVDHVLYAPAADSPETRLLVRALRTAAGRLDQDIESLTRVDDAHRAKTLAQSIEARLVTHLAGPPAPTPPAPRTAGAAHASSPAAPSAGPASAPPGDTSPHDWPTWLC
jgi:hypothetical protein